MEVDSCAHARLPCDDKTRIANAGQLDDGIAYTLVSVDTANSHPMRHVQVEIQRYMLDLDRYAMGDTNLNFDCVPFLHPDSIE